MNSENRVQFKRVPIIMTIFILSGASLILLLLLGNVQPLLASDCQVPAAYSTIQDAVDEPSCTIIIVAAGTYSENVVVDRSLTLLGAGSSDSIIDGAGSGRPVAISGSDVVVEMQGFRLTNGNATSASPNSRFGGGILVTGGATLHGDGLQIDNNIATTAAQTGFGGGLAILNGTAYLTNTLVLSNTASLRGPGFRANGTGGGLYAAGVTGSGQAVLYLTDSEVKYNVANDSPGDGNAFAIGGGLRVGDSENTHVVINNTLWEGNMARGLNAGADNDALGGVGDGGAVAVRPSNSAAYVSITNSIMRGNVANASADIPSGANNARGGAIIADNGSGNGLITVMLTNVDLIDNIAKAGSGDAVGQGGGLYARNSNIFYNGGLIDGNIAAQDGANRGLGGGIRLSGVGTTILEADGLTLLNNVALVGTSAAMPSDSQGGGIQVSGADGVITVTNTILADNHAANTGGSGAGVYVGADALATLVHLTVAAESQNNGQGIYHGPTGSPDNVQIINTIVANHATGIHNQGFAGAVVESYTLFFGNTQNTIGSVVGGTGSFEDDPAFVNAAAGDYHITAQSAAIDAGTDAGVMVDIDGDSRPQGAGFDIGADEYVPPVAPTSVTIEGPTSGVVNESYSFTAVVSPPDVTQPLTYTWSPEPVSGQGTMSATYVWNTAGPQQIEVTVENEAGSVNDSHTITINEEAIAPTSVTIEGPTGGLVDEPYSFTAVVSPSDVTEPLTYTWSPAPVSGQGTMNATYVWNSPGPQQIDVTVENEAGSASASHTITISTEPEYQLYLPVIIK